MMRQWFLRRLTLVLFEILGVVAQGNPPNSGGVAAVPKGVWYCLGILLGLLSLIVLCRCCAKITEEKIEDSSLINPKSRNYKARQAGTNHETPEPSRLHPGITRGSLGDHPGINAVTSMAYNRTADLENSFECSEDLDYISLFDSIDDIRTSLTSTNVERSKLGVGGRPSRVEGKVGGGPSRVEGKVGGGAPRVEGKPAKAAESEGGVEGASQNFRNMAAGPDVVVISHTLPNAAQAWGEEDKSCNS